jgi:hypothetical protein
MAKLINLMIAIALGIFGSTAAVMLGILVMSHMVVSAGSVNIVSVLFGCFLIFTTIAGIISGISGSYCSNCRRFFRLRYSAKVLVKPTADSEGKKRIIRHCPYCSYYREYEETIPELGYLEPP